MTIDTTRGQRPRSKAWVYYLILACICFFGIFAGQWICLPLTAGFGLYSRYLYRGGRVVIWFW